MQLYRQIAHFLKDKQNLFILGKGVGLFAANYIASKFMQVSSIHAEAYSSAEFRHGPLSMIDEVEQTPGKSHLLAKSFSNLLGSQRRTHDLGPRQHPLSQRARSSNNNCDKPTQD